MDYFETNLADREFTCHIISNDPQKQRDKRSEDYERESSKQRDRKNKET